MSTTKQWKQFLTHRTVLAALMLVLTGSFASYEFFKPAAANAASIARAAAPLDENSVSALMALDRAMETLAARVNPAVVNVTVASRAKAQISDRDQAEIQRFFGPGFGQQMRPPQVEHGLGSGTIIPPDGSIATTNH